MPGTLARSMSMDLRALAASPSTLAAAVLLPGALLPAAVRVAASPSTPWRLREIAGGESVQRRIRAPGNRIGRLIAAGKSDDEILDELYLAAIARPPRPGELQAIRDEAGKGLAERREVLEDVLWVLINSKEFLFRR